MRHRDHKREHDRRLETLRNIGVLAHVDAGKTTLSERLLFAAGELHRMGEVHDGASALDHRGVERAHGVTVSAAAAVIDWRDHRVTLLDTPGHVDFAQEVECALLAIDSAVVVLSAVAGVEPQTESVWAQADRRALPRLVFVNKMDAVGADFDRVVAEAGAKLGSRLAALHWPQVSEHGAIGMVDLIDQVWLTWPDPGADALGPEHLSPRRAAVPDGLRGEAARRREALVEAAMETGAPDEAALAAWLEGGAVDAASLRALLRRACVARRLVPVLAGAAYRGVGVTALLDAVVELCPSPADRGEVIGRQPGADGSPEERRAPDASGPFAGLVSKVAVTRFGPVATLRVISGALRRGDPLANPRADAIERAGRLTLPLADGGVEAEAAAAGEIVAVSGLKHAQAGDTLCAPGAPVLFAEMARAAPVISAAIEPVTAEDQAKLGAALAALCREDPSLRVETDAETGQLLLAGMGELHLQIALEALAAERGVSARIGRPRIAYRETISRPAEAEHTLRKQSGGPGQFARLRLRLEPDPSLGDGVAFEDRTAGGVIPAAFMPAVETALRAAAAEGPLAGYPAQGLRAIVLDGAHHAQDSSALAFANAARAAFRLVFAAAAPQLLEPIARMEIRAPEPHLGAVIADLQARRGAVL
ncbi:MAG: GTP-binding protein, partial [Pseudomonadota bacterium]